MHLIEYVKTSCLTGHPLAAWVPFTKDELDKSDSLEVWGTSFNDIGQDYCEFKLIKDGVAIRVKRQEGY